MKKSIKKLSAIALAAIMVLAMGVTAFADPAELGAGGTVVDKTNGVSNVIKIEKSLVFKNPTETSVYGPNITYSYAVTAGTPSKDITDSDDIHAATLAGKSNATVSGTVSWDSDTKYTASAAGTANVKDFTITFDESAYDAAGVYRYVITESVVGLSAKADAGVADGDISAVRYLDVYVKNGTTAGTYKIYGYALFSNDNSIYDGTVSTNTVAAAGKTTGFVAGDEDNDGNTETADTYETINLVVSKTLVGDAGMNNHAFPFEVSITNSDIKTAVKLITKTGALASIDSGSEGDPIDIAADAAGMTTTDTSHSIKTADAVKYVGIPALTEANYTVKEKNDVAGTTYESSYIIDTGSKSGIKNIEKDAWSETASVTADDSADHKVVFTNDLKLISPTGVVLRIAPYALMLAAGVVLLVLSRRRKFQFEEA